MQELVKIFLIFFLYLSLIYFIEKFYIKIRSRTCEWWSLKVLFKKRKFIKEETSYSFLKYSETADSDNKKR